MPGLYDSDALLAMWVRVGLLAVERYASRTGDTFLLSSRDLCQVAATYPVSNAIRKFQRLAADPAGAEREGSGKGAGSPLELSRSGAFWKLRFPNLRQKQGFGSTNGGRTENPSASASTSDKLRTTRAKRTGTRADLSKTTRESDRHGAERAATRPRKRAVSETLTRAYALAREEIALLKPSSLPAIPSKSALRDLGRLLDRYPDEPPEIVIPELVRGAAAYWQSVNPEAEMKTIRARLVLSTLCTERGSDKYREHGRKPDPQRVDPQRKPQRKPQAPAPTAAEQARSDRVGKLFVALLRRSRRVSKQEHARAQSEVEAAFARNDEAQIRKLEAEFLAPEAEEECPI